MEFWQAIIWTETEQQPFETMIGIKEAPSADLCKRPQDTSMTSTGAYPFRHVSGYRSSIDDKKCIMAHMPMLLSDSVIDKADLFFISPYNGCATGIEPLATSTVIYQYRN